jgi:hypothetical protein
MAYSPCAKVCWAKLFTSFQPFSSRIVAQYQYDLTGFWTTSYAHSAEKHPNWGYWLVVCLIIPSLKNIAKIVLLRLILLVGIVFYGVGFILSIVRCLIFPCPLAHKIPEITNFEDLIQNLRGEVNEELTWLNKVTAPIFTPLKETGFSNSWDDYPYWVMAKGDVIQLAQSWDGIKTIDVKLLNVSVFDNKKSFLASNFPTETPLWQTDFTPQNPKFIRVEIYPQVALKHNFTAIQVSEMLVISGQLRWDRDGFFEIHPQ